MQFEQAFERMNCSEEIGTKVILIYSSDRS